MTEALVLVVSLVVILVGAELFTNGVEWLGFKLNLSRGAVGSVLAAVGTALPETAVPILAFFAGPPEAGSEIGLGAILGAPFMLSTLAMFITGLAVAYHGWRRRRSRTVRADAAIIGRDLAFFLGGYTLALAASAAPRAAQLGAAFVLVVGYAVYVYLSFADQDEEGESELAPERLYLTPQVGTPRLASVVVQILAALGLIVAGAHYFVEALQNLASLLGLSPLVLSLIVTPVATELPEKVNSILWIGRGKDTLALGNISGAMVFQGSILPALAILLAEWRLEGRELLTGVLALASALFLFARMRRGSEFGPGWLLAGGVFYAAYVVAVVFRFGRTTVI